ncbi:MAG: glycosyltransferase family 4 protein [Acidimicrobiales bacterium]
MTDARIVTPSGAGSKDRPPAGARRAGAWVAGAVVPTLSPVRVDQVIPSLASRDAIGVHTVNLLHAFRAAGIDSDVYYGTCSEDLVALARPIAALGRGGHDRVLLYQASIGSPVFDVLAARPERKLVNYHNITPSELLAAWEPSIAYETSLGRAQLERLAPRCELAIAVSRFNEQELVDAGYRRTAVVPLLIDMTRSAGTSDQGLSRRLSAAKAAGGADLLYVGKISPHKAPHDLVKMLSVYRRVYDPAARLHLVGSPFGERYGGALEAFVDELGLGDVVTVTGSVSPAELEAYWDAADVYVSASDHEGFGVPLVEAMGHGVPVVAYEAGAVRETVGDAGLVLESKEPLRFAAAVARVVSDATLRARLVDAGTRRVGELGVERSAARFLELVRAASSA